MSWWNSNWSYRKKLTFDNSGQSENLQDFPVLVALTSSNFDFTKAKDNGEDVRFVNSDDTTELKYEIENWDKTNEKAWLWVKVPQINGSSDTDHIYMYYGNSGASDNQDAANTWDSYYKAVYHLHKASGDVVDSKGVHAGTNHGATRGQTGKIDKAFDFDGLDDYVDCGEGAGDFDLVSAWTLEIYANVDIDKAGSNIIGKRYNDPITANNYWMELKTSNIGTGFYNGAWKNLNVGGTYSAGVWYYLVSIWDGTYLRLYKDGAIIGTSADYSATPPIANDYNLQIGRANSTSPTEFDGKIDEVRISDIARSADWLKAQYLSMTLAFITFGAEDGQLISSEAGSGVEGAPTLLAGLLVSDIGSGLDIGGLFFTASDVGSGFDAILALKAVLTGVDAGSALEAAFLLKALLSVDGGLGTDALVSLLARITVGEEGSGSDHFMVKIESAARGGEVRLPLGAGATSIPSREVHL